MHCQRGEVIDQHQFERQQAVQRRQIDMLVRLHFFWISGVYGFQWPSRPLPYTGSDWAHQASHYNDYGAHRQNRSANPSCCAAFAPFPSSWRATQAEHLSLRGDVNLGGGITRAAVGRTLGAMTAQHVTRLPHMVGVPNVKGRDGADVHGGDADVRVAAGG